MPTLGRREFLEISTAGAAGVLLAGCISRSVCRADLVGLAGTHTCPHRFCRYHPDRNRGQAEAGVWQEECAARALAGTGAISLR